MSILNAVKLAVLAAVAVKVATGSFKVGRFMGNVAGGIEQLKANGFTDEQIATFDEMQFNENLMNTVGKQA
jgi:hypothetical protein